MSLLYLNNSDEHENPLDLIEKVVSANNWPFDRYDSEEINVSVEGAWTRYQMWFAWKIENQALQFSCAFDFKVPKEKLIKIYELLAFINEKLWLGHFDIWPEEGMLMFRYSLLFSGGVTATIEQMEDLVEIALKECEKFYPAIHFMLWANKSPKDAVASAMLETKGQA